jgi:thiamine biosynthesis lipoprotein
MRQTRVMMGMPITVEIADLTARQAAIDRVFGYFDYVDRKFSTYKPDSEISRINAGELQSIGYSEDMRQVLKLSEETRRLTDGYFDIRRPDGRYDPSGLVKGLAIHNAAKMLAAEGYVNYYVEAGGDIEAHGYNAQGQPWQIGIQSPFVADQIVKVLRVTDRGVATSGTYVRGQHIYDPKRRGEPITDIVGLTVIGPDIYEADRYATAAFAMGKPGINLIERTPGLEGYMIGKDGVAVMTTGFESYVDSHV